MFITEAKASRPTGHSESGFTLIEVSIALLIISILLGPTINELGRYYKERRSTETTTNMRIINKAIQEYYYAFKTYPCPADPALSPADPDYGEPVDCHAAGWLPGGAAGGPVSTGAVPFKALKIAVESSLDGWKNKIMYSVSTAMTTDPADPNAELDPADAALTFMGWDSRRSDPTVPDSPYIYEFVNYGDPYPLPATPPPTRLGHYILLSTGLGGVGGYTADGVLIEACPPPANATMESENCNGDALFNANSGPKHARHIQSDLAGPQYYDDETLYTYDVPRMTWTTAANPADIFADNGRFGIGKVPHQDIAVDVEGNIKIRNENLSAFKVCVTDESNNSDCFVPSLITADDPDMECGAGEVSAGIRNSSMKCRGSSSLGYNAAYTGSCPAGWYVTSIDASGIQCQEP